MNARQLPPPVIYRRGENVTSNENNEAPTPPHNLVAIIAVSVGLTVLFIVAGFMCAFRVGWNKGLEYRKNQDRKLLSAAAAKRKKSAIPWPGEPPAISDMWEIGTATPVSLGLSGSFGRHSFRPEKGVYEISEESGWSESSTGGRSRTVSEGRTPSVSSAGKGKAREIAI